MAALAAAALAFPSGGVEAQVLGRVIDQANQGPVPNAGVALVDSAGTVRGQVVSDETGRFIMPIGMPGTYSVQVVALGYVANAVEEFVYQGQRIFLEVTVAPAPIETEGLEVVVESQQVHLVMAGFYDRQRMGGGDFIGPEDIERLRATRPGHLLRRFASVTLLENQEPIFNRNQGVSPESGTCLPNVWIDGYPIRTRNFQRVRTTIDDESGTGGEDLTAYPERFDLIVPPAEMIAAIEAYPGGSSVPARWRTRSSGCGVIVVWTRRR
jgi:hypothetical protein